MADLIPHVSPSADLVYRVNRRGRPLFQPPDWEHAGPEQKFNGRYDDPAGLSMPQALRFRTIYCGTRSAALSEIIAGKGLRPDLQTIAQLKTLDPNLPAEPRSLGFTISEEWRSTRWLERARLHHDLRFADMTAPETPQLLGSVPRLAHIALALQLTHQIKEFDLDAIIGPQRELTQAIARYVYELVDIRGQPLYAGLHFISRLCLTWECWAVFDSRIHFEPGSPGIPETILHDNPGLREVAITFRLPIESRDGRLLCPWREDDTCPED